MCELTVDKAREVIDFISSTNYKLATCEGELLSTKNDAIQYVTSPEYVPTDSLQVIHETVKGDRWESVHMYYCEDSKKWTASDLYMGGLEGGGDTIEESLRNYQSAFNTTPEAGNRPIDLIIEN